MLRRRSFAALAFGLVTLSAVPTVLGQGSGTPDRIRYRDFEGKLVDDAGELKESPKGIEWLNANRKTISISPDQVVKIEPTNLAGVPTTDLLTARSQEDVNPGKAAAAYGEMLKKAGPNAPERSRRFLAYKEAYFTVKAVDAKGGKEFESEAGKAAEKMNAAAKTAIRSWEVWPASRIAARLYAELGDFPKATAVLGSLASVPDLPKDLKHEANLLEAAMALRGRNAPAARSLLDRLASDKDFPAVGPARDRLSVMRVAAGIAIPAAPSQAPLPADAVKNLLAAIDAAKDPAARGIGHLVLGDLYAGHGQARDAMWMYLTVDVVYNADRDDQIVAVRRLIPIFEAAGDKDKVDQFREKLPRIR